MKERPILFSAPMVRAILEGRKTQTRRILKRSTEFKGPYSPEYIEAHQHSKGWAQICPYGQPGDVLWVRECWQTHCGMDGIRPRDLPRDAAIQYPATYDGWVSRRRPSIFMPRWASRITLSVTDVRVQRLQDISEEDAIAEDIAWPAESEIDDPDWSICDRCGGTLLYDGIGPNLGVMPDCDCYECDTAKKRFKCLWNYINGNAENEGDAWTANPWVYALSFKIAEKLSVAA